MLARLKASVVARVGLGPALNAQVTVRGLRALPALVAHERLESQRIGPVASADCVTIIPTIGRESLLSAVESARNQDVDLKNCIVVVTDGPVKLPALPDDVVVLRTSRRCGVPGVLRNIGLCCTNSTFVAFLDDDNTWLRNHLRTALETLCKDVDIAYSSASRRLPYGNQIYDMIGQQWNRDEIRHANWVDTSAIVARRVKGLRFSRIPRPAGTQFAEDWEFVYRLSRRLVIAWTGQATVEYAMSEGLTSLLETLRAPASPDLEGR